MARGESKAPGHTASSAEEHRARSVCTQLFILAMPVKRLTYGMVPAPGSVGPPAPVSLTDKPSHREAWKLDSVEILSPVRSTPTTTPVLYEISENSWRFLSCCPRMANMPLQLTCKINDGSICAKNSVTTATVTPVSRTSLWLVWYSRSSKFPHDP